MSALRPSAAVRLLLAVCLALAANPVLADDPPANQADAEARLDALRRDIESLQQQLAESRTAHQEAQQDLRRLDLSIQESTRRLRELDASREAHRQRLRQLERERDTERQRMADREAELSAQLVSTYRLARQSRLKLVLNQDDPLKLGRMLAYYDYINRAQVGQIAALRSALRTLEQLLRSIDDELARIEALQREEQATLAARQDQRQARERLLAELGQEIGTGTQRLAELERDRVDLEKLVERLGSALMDIPADLGRQAGLGDRKGRLEMPVSARVRHAFGQQRAADLRWQGWLLDAPAGSEVRSIAYGRVAFADWFRGYGLMMIIDHGQGFMSLYGYNESLLWEVGDWVPAGTVIATVGSGPSGEQGLYFELRRDGKAIDPAAWIDR